MIVRFIIVLFLLIALLVPAVGVFAQSAQIQEKLTETKTKVEQLAEIKDSQEISDEEKQHAELSIKKTVLFDVLDLGVLQMEEIKKKLDTISFPSTDEWSSIRSGLYALLDSHIAYYNETTTRVATMESLDLATIQATAQTVETYKITILDPSVRAIGDIIMVFNVDSILSLADQRLSKIRTDIEKIYTNNIAKTEELKELFSSASRVLDRAHHSNNQAKEIILHLYDPSVDASTRTFLSSLLNSLMFSESEPPKEDGSLVVLDLSPIVPTDSLPAVSYEQRVFLAQHINDLAINSLVDIKDTYDIFITMSTKARDLMR